MCSTCHITSVCFTFGRFLTERIDKHGCRLFRGLLHGTDRS
jgi:hypothetical protein